VAQGAPNVGTEYFLAGLEKNPTHAKLREALILTETDLLWSQQLEIERLEGVGNGLYALKLATNLEERQRRYQSLDLPFEDPDKIQADRKRIHSEVESRLASEVDERLTRGNLTQNDLRACRSLEALQVNDQTTARKCDRLLAKLQINATVGLSPSSSRLAKPFASTLLEEILEFPGEILNLAKSVDDRNAHIAVYVGEPEFFDTDWYLQRRNQHHEWVQKTDRKGNPVQDKFTTTNEETGEEIVTYKNVFEFIEYEYRYFGRIKTVRIPYSITLYSLKSNNVIVSFDGHKHIETDSRYFEFSGDHRGRVGQSMPQGRDNAASLKPENQLIKEALAGAPKALVEQLVKHVE
jgi:hypothetical protein